MQVKINKKIYNIKQFEKYSVIMDHIECEAQKTNRDQLCENTTYEQNMLDNAIELPFSENVIDMCLFVDRFGIDPKYAKSKIEPGMGFS